MAYIAEQSVAERGPDTGSLMKTSQTLRWALINGWRVDPQSNDRPPVVGVVAPSGTSASARRSMARRKHQAMFKAWSQDRNE